jgi:hypothetical protein
MECLAALELDAQFQMAANEMLVEHAEYQAARRSKGFFVVYPIL